ncbi:hypothetical protein BT96DRAFT_846796 [Gymnopus androsaceus JB14]|uniref:Pentatricopeptide repeat-containing protein-mitochondrial domain-containing protein n=1 Tax=Gymnopus androsaceus JB14 TaxID=1447944 RepID=A0A6A4IKG2_9AGAR|nr:hypothetical protein BT96DRAFT_846796 [Gymnopus androsaceus JB14]
MLRRAGFAHRQHLEQVPFGIITRISSFSPRPSISVRCLPLAALATRPSTLRLSLSGIHKSEPTPLVNADHDVTQNSPLTSPLPVDLLATLLSRKLSEAALRREILAIPSLSEHLLDNTRARQLAEAIALTPDYHLAVKALQSAHILGCHLKQNAYECTAHHLATKHRWTAVLSVVSLGKRHTARTTIRLLNWRIRALVETGQHALLRNIPAEFEAFQVKPNRRTFHLLISGHVRNRDLLGARKLLRLMGQIGIPPDDSTHALIATYYRNLGPNVQVQDQALRSLSSLEENTAVTVLNRLIQLRLDANDPAATLQLLTLFDQKQVGCIAEVVSGVVSTPGGGNPFAQPLEDVHRTRYLSADGDTYATFIHYMATRKDLHGALVILKGLVAANISPTPEVITALIHVYFATGLSKAAFRTVLDICAQRPLDAFTSLEYKGLYNPGASLHFVPTGIVPTTRMFNALLNGALSAHGFTCAWDILKVMQANNIRPNEVTVEVLIAYAGKSQHTRPRLLLRLLSKLHFPELQPTLGHLHILLSCIIRHERYLTFGVGWNTTASLFSRTRQVTRTQPKSLSLSNSTEPFDPIGGIPLEGVNWRAARPFVDQLSARKTNVDGVLAGIRLKREAALKVDMDAAQDVFDLLLARGIQPNEYHFSALMEGYTRKGDVSSAVDILEAATRVGIKPNRVMYTILIVGYARQGQPEEAVTTFKRMVEADIQPDVASIDAVASAFFAVGSYLMARRTLITLWPYVRPFPEELESAPLKELATQFRLLQKDGQDSSNLTRSQWKRLYRQLSRLITAWNASKSSSHVQEVL